MKVVIYSLLTIFSLCLFLATNVEAGQAKYLYDDLGRLIQVIDEHGNVANYNYDAVGNLLSITTNTGGVGAPTIASVTPTQATAGQSVSVTLSGTDLTGATLSTDNAGISISGVQTAATSLKATLTLSYSARVGPTTLTVRSSAGAATASFTVNAPPPLILELQPNNGPVSRLVRINGQGFGTSPAQVSVTFGGVPATLINVTATAIDTQVPAGVSLGAVPVVVTVNGVASSGQTFTVSTTSGPAPVITSLSPVVGSEQGGTTVRIRGSGFSAATPEVSIGDYHIIQTTYYFASCIPLPTLPGAGMLAASSSGGSAPAVIPCMTTIRTQNFYKFLGIPVIKITIIDDTTMDVVTPPGPVGPSHILISNSNGDALLKNGFTYLAGPPQSILGISPTLGLTTIPTNVPISLLFTRPVDRSSITTATFGLAPSSNNTPVAGTFSYGTNDTLVTFRPTAALSANTAYTLNITQGIKSADGIPLDGPFTGFFTTAGGSDTLSPTFTLNPSNGATNVPYNASVTVVFNEPINPLTLNTTSFIVSNNGSVKAGFIAVGQQSTVATFIPASPFFPGTPVTVTLKGTITDLAGNAIIGNNGAGSDYTAGFTTATTKDLFPPQVLQINPKNGATGINTNTAISVTFNESLNPATVNSSTFVVSAAGGTIPGSIAFSNFNTVATYLPSQPLPGLTPITVTLTSGVTDLAGNALAAPFNATFTTTSSIDNFQPSVISFSPFDGQTGVAQNAKVTLVFSERINPVTVNANSFYVTGPAGIIPGNISVSADQLSATFTPSVPLLPNAGHSINFGNQITDIAGNPLFNPTFGPPGACCAKVFTTGSGPADKIGPTVVAVAPVNGAVNLPLNANILIKFSEPIAGTSLNAQTILLSHGGQPVDTTLSLEQNGFVVRVKPANLVNLLSNTFYELTVTTGVTDVVGNPLQAQFTSSFTTTTGTVSDTVRPTLISTTPASGSTGVSQNTTVAVTFSEPINPVSVNAATFTLTGGGIGGVIPGSFSFSADQKTVIFTPTYLLFGNQSFSINLGGIEDLAGNPFNTSNPQVFAIFTTGYAAGTDLTKLPGSANVIVNPSRLYADGQSTTTVIISNISTGGTLVPNGTKVAVTVNPAYSLTSAGGTILGGTVSAADPRFQIFTTLGGSITLTYQSSNHPELAPGTTLTATIQVAQVDVANAPMGLIGTSTVALFRGRSVTISPNPVNLLAASGSTDHVTITVFDSFGNPVPAGMRVGVSANPVYTLSSLGGSLLGGVPAADTRFNIYSTITGGIVELDYIPPILTSSQSGTATIQVVEVDDAGNLTGLLGSGVINLSGSTGNTAPQPVILATSPASGQSNVGLNAPIVVSFSQSLDPTSVTATTFSISSGGTVQGSRTLSSGVGGPNSVITFTPSVPFSPNAVVSVFVGTSIKSSTGNPLLASKTYTFSTGVTSDTTAPSVTLINPANGAAGVGTNTQIIAQFSESMNAASITPLSMTLSAGGSAISGHVSVTNKVGDTTTPSLIAIFTPDQLLSANTAYTVNLSSSITDTAGNPLVPFTSTFTTATGIDNFQPSVISFSPFDGETGIPQNAKVTLVFSERINPESVNASTFVVSGPAGVVTGSISVSADQLSATFTPSVPLLPNALHAIGFSDQITDIAGNKIVNPTFTSSGSSRSKSFVTGSGPADTTGPFVLQVAPANGAVNLPLNANLLIKFSEPIAGTSVNNQSVVVSTGGVAVPGTITLEQNNTVVRWRAANLALLSANTTYQVVINTSITDLAGNSLAAPFTGAFTTGSASDAVRPTVVSVTPAHGSSGVSQSTSISVTFSEPINPLSVNAATFTLTGGGISGAVPGSLSFSTDQKTFTFTPSAPLPGNQNFTTNLGAIEDFAGNTFVNPGVLQLLTGFTTGYAAGTDLTTLPNSATVTVNPNRLYADGQSTTTVIISNISRNGTLAPNGTKVAVTVNPAYSLTSAGGTILGGTVSAADPRFQIFTTLGGSITFTYQSSNHPELSPSGSLNVTIQVAQVDVANAPMGLIGTSTVTLFRGRSVTISPNPVNLLAASGSTDHVTITVFDSFGNPVPAGMRVGVTANPVYTLSSLGGSLLGGVPAADTRFNIYSTITGGIVELDYIPPILTSSQSGTATIQVVEVDDAGNLTGLLGSNTISLSGSTGNTAPQPVILATSPASGQSNVALNAPIVVSFSQSLDPTSVTATTFSISSGGSISGTRTLSAGVGGPNSVVTFTPSAPFSPNAVVSVFVGTSIKSSTGNPLLASKTSTFSTGVGADTSAPSVTLINPANGAAGVGTNTLIVTQFSESMNAASITPLSMMLSAGGSAVSGRVSVTNKVGDTATPSLIASFTPDQLLSPNTTYTVNLSSAITDTAGNALIPFTSNFTTGTGIDNFQPSVISISPFDGETGIPQNAKVTLVFSERINPESVNASTFVVSGPAGVVTGSISVSADQLSATFTPSVPLLPNALHAIGFSDQITDIAGNKIVNPTFTSSGSSGSKSFVTGSGPADSTGPSVLQVAPSNGAVNLPLNANILIKFSEPIAGTSLNAQTILLSQGGQPVSTVLSLEQNGLVVRVKPANLINLLPNTIYNMTVTTGVTDLAGNPLTAPFTSTFTTGSTSDAVSPTVVSFTPSGVGVSQSASIIITFNEPINPLSVNSVTFTLTGGGVDGVIPGSYSFSADQKTFIFTPSAPLPGNQTFSIKLGAVEDFAGNTFVNPGVLQLLTGFTTGYAAGTDLTTLPNSATVTINPSRLYADGQSTTTVIISNISRNGTLAPNGTKVAVTVNPAYSLTSTGGTILGGTVSAADPRFQIFTTLGGSITLTYQSSNHPELAPGTTLTATIQVAQVDVANAPMGLIGSGSITLFRGRSVTISPNPVNLLAASGSTDHVTITVFDSFGNPVPAGMRVGVTANPVYTLSSLGGSLLGGVAAADTRFNIYSTITGGIVELDYIPPILTSSQSGTATIQVVEVDDAGNLTGLLGSNTISLSGSTGNTAPQPIILATSPASGQSNVALNAPIVVSFSQSLDPTSVTATTFSIASGGSLSGTRTLSSGVGGPNSVVTFTPSVPFSPNAAVSVFVGTSIKSSTGNPLLASKTYAFSTGVTSDTTPPSVTLINPANGAAGVGTNTQIIAQFSESMNAASITPLSMTLSAGGTPISGHVSVTNKVGDTTTPSLIAIFTPDQLLSANTTYTVNLSAAITDTAGNALTPFASTFTTGSGIDNFQPTILAISPANNAVDVPSTIAITVTFNEPMNPVTINEKTLTLNGPGGVVNASYSMANGNASATLTPLQPLFAGDQYSLTLSTAITDIAGNPLASAVTSSFKTALAPGTTNLPTTATVTVNPGSLFANGQISTTVTISNISAGGVLVPNGTLIAVTADPAFTSSSTGGTISGSSTGSSADPRFQLFSAFGAKVTISYTPPDLTGQGIGTLGSATIQAASVDLDNFPVGLIGSGTVSLFGINSVTISANPTVVPADGSSTSQLSVTVKDVNGNLVPDGTRIALTAAPIFNQVSAGGAILGGTASAADARVKIFTTAGGQFTATYQAPLNPGTGLAVIQVMSIDVGGRPTALVGAASINFPPANDNFSNAQVISGNTGTVNGSNVNASKEAGEPNHAGNAGGKSVWYRWTAPNSGAVSIDTIGSSFDTLLGVYTGSSVSGLTLIASNDNFGGNTTSKVTFTAVGGTVYQIAVDGFSGATGSVTLNWSLTP